MTASTRMVTRASQGDTCGAEITGHTGGAFLVELDTGETAILPIGNLDGCNYADKLERASELGRGKQVQVSVDSAYDDGRGKNRITVRELRTNDTRRAPVSRTPVRPTGRILYPVDNRRYA